MLGLSKGTFGEGTEMMLVIECVMSCIIFGVIIILYVLRNQASWINEYPELVQKRYIELHPGCEITEPEDSSPRVMIRKGIACMIFLILLVGIIYFAGARSFAQGVSYCYCMWFV